MAKDKSKEVEMPKSTVFTYRKVIVGRKSATPRFVSACPNCNR